MSRDSAIFYRSFWDAIKILPPEDQVMAYNAIFSKTFDDVEIEVTGFAKSIYTLIKPQIEANNRRFKNGSTGGRGKSGEGSEPNPPQKEIEPEANVNQNETKQEPSRNQTGTKPEPNANANANANVNVNVNANVSKLLTEQEVFELMKLEAPPDTDVGLIQNEAAAFFRKYKSNSVKDLQALIRSWASRTNWKKNGFRPIQRDTARPGSILEPC